MILIDMNLCIGCYKCIDACPYGVRYIDPSVKLKRPDREKDFGIGKCTFCEHRVDNGIEPSCVQACPASDALSFSLPKGKKPLSRRAMLVAVTGVFVLGIGLAQLTGRWDNTISQDEYRQRISELNSPKYEHNRGQVPEYTPGD